MVNYADYSGVSKDLDLVQISLGVHAKFNSMKDIEEDLSHQVAFLRGFPMDAVDNLVDQTTSNVQKKTAYMMLKRFYNNPEL